MNDLRYPKLSRTALPEVPCATSLAGKRIMFLINLDGGGGVEKMLSILARAFRQWGAEVTTRALYQQPDESALRKLAGIVRAPARILAGRPDILVTFQPTSSAVAALTRPFTTCRMHLVHQSNMPAATHRIPRTFDWLLGSMGFYPVVIANSKANEDAFADYPASYRRCIKRIVHGIDWHPPQRTRSQVRAALGIAEDTPVLLTCARLSPQKSLNTVISALPDVPGATLVIAGDGPHRRDLEALAATLRVADRVIFLGHQPPDAISDLNAAADLFVFPSLWETFGLAALEAALQGTPVIASPLPVTLEVLSVAGAAPAVVVKDWSPENWADALRQALGDLELRSRAAASAPLLRRHYSEAEMLDKYRLLLAQLPTAIPTPPDTGASSPKSPDTGGGAP